MCSNDFHNELYGYVQHHLESQKGDGKFAKEEEVDSYLVSKGLKRDWDWARTSTQKYKTTLPVFVRNSIHHPENNLNGEVTERELRDSTKALVSIVESINRSS